MKKPPDWETAHGSGTSASTDVFRRCIKGSHIKGSRIEGTHIEGPHIEGFHIEGSKNLPIIAPASHRDHKTLDREVAPLLQEPWKSIDVFYITDITLSD